MGLRWGGWLEFLEGQKDTKPSNVDTGEEKHLSSNSNTVVSVTPFPEWVKKKRGGDFLEMSVLPELLELITD